MIGTFFHDKLSKSVIFQAMLNFDNFSGPLDGKNHDQKHPHVIPTTIVYKTVFVDDFPIMVDPGILTWSVGEHDDNQNAFLSFLG